MLAPPLKNPNKQTKRYHNWPEGGREGAGPIRDGTHPLLILEFRLHDKMRFDIDDFWGKPFCFLFKKRKSFLFKKRKSFLVLAVFLVWIQA